MADHDVSGIDEPPGSQTLPGLCTMSAMVRGPRDDVIVSTPTNPTHNVMGIHFCTNVHEDYHGITLHVCQCGARFYFVRDAVEVLVGGFTKLKATILELQARSEDHGDRLQNYGL